MSTVNVVALVLGLLRDADLDVRARLTLEEVRPVGRVQESGGPQSTSQGPNRLTVQDLRVEWWGDDKTQAWDAIATARDALLAAPRTQPSRPQGVLVRIGAQSPMWMPDEDWPDPQGRPGPRYLMIVRATAHP